MDEVLEVIGLTKIYGDGMPVVALQEISLSLHQNDYLAIVGPSGSGKSTLIHIMGGLEHPTRGQVTFKGKNIYHMRDKEISLWRRGTVGFVFQFYHLIEELNVYENIMIASSIRKQEYSSKRVKELLQYLEIEERKDFFPSQLSGGEKQKVAIARAVVNDPDIIFCDEPTGNLDSASQVKVMQLLERLNREMKKAVILVTHNLELAKRAKRIISLEGGQLVSS